MDRMDEAARRRRLRREFIRTRHPDRGGDPAEFVAGLAALDADVRSSDRQSGAAPSRDAGSPLDPLPRVFVVARQPWPRSLVTRLLHRITRRRGPTRVR